MTAAANKRIGIMGGTFDPIHNAHLSLGRCAKAELQLDEVWFMPAGDPYLKHSRKVSSATDRAAMTALAIEGLPGFRLSCMEMERTGETYTSETLELLHACFPETHFYFILGSDSLYQIERWHAPETILQLATLVAARREYADRPRSFQEQVRYLETRYGAAIAPLSFEETDISSTEIRARVARGEDISALVPNAVSEYIKEHRLYVEN